MKHKKSTCTKPDSAHQLRLLLLLPASLASQVQLQTAAAARMCIGCYIGMIHFPLLCKFFLRYPYSFSQVCGISWHFGGDRLSSTSTTVQCAVTNMLCTLTLQASQSALSLACFNKHITTPVGFLQVLLRLLSLSFLHICDILVATDSAPHHICRVYMTCLLDGQLCPLYSE